MKTISIELQKILKYIPLLNCAIFAVFLYNCMVLQKTLRTQWMGILQMICASLPIHIICKLLVVLIPTAEHLLQFLTQYLVGIICGCILIKIQETW